MNPAPLKIQERHFGPIEYLRKLTESGRMPSDMKPMDIKAWEYDRLLDRLMEMDACLASMADSNGNTVTTNWPAFEARVFRYLSTSRNGLRILLNERAAKLLAGGVSVRPIPDMPAVIMRRTGHMSQGFTQAQMKGTSVHRHDYPMLSVEHRTSMR